jgi:hypothetical protein
VLRGAGKTVYETTEDEPLGSAHAMGWAQAVAPCAFAGLGFDFKRPLLSSWRTSKVCALFGFWRTPPNRLDPTGWALQLVNET